VLPAPPQGPYRTVAHVSADAEAWDPDPTRRQRLFGVVLAAVSLTLLAGLAPLVAIFAVVEPALAAATWLAAALVQVGLALTSAHLLFAARQGDRTRAQGFCLWLGCAALVLSVLGVISAAAGALAVAFLSSIPWCGVCGT
jgi:hypothetical protein